ncbi:exopolysaccharide biosynthesis WecB/TagA/CpsF family protein [Arthrobacter sp. UYCu511]|uniref:WecB/TagA/CpsF family glycosyltransferase n=1 Tax=Arthrobacter sp. UYCu511 TaxID=3156337 RepID=UPI0033942A14
MAIDVPESMYSAGIPVHLVDFERTMSIISHRLVEAAQIPLCVVSINLDHIHHFGTSGRWNGALEHAGPSEFLNLIDGAPIAAQARRSTGRVWPRLAGSDLIEPILEKAIGHGSRIGFLGGSLETQQALQTRFAAERPDMAISGWWSPERSQLSNHGLSKELAAEIRAAQTDVLVVGLGKPRQELWMAEYAAHTGAKVLLGFGAAVDFMAGKVARAPRWASDNGLEWAWRLSREPRRLSRRYLVDGPSSYVALRASTGVKTAPKGHTSREPYRIKSARAVPVAGSFAGPEDTADVAVLVVTYNNADDIPKLLKSLREETADHCLRVIVADNSSSDATLETLAAHPDVITVSTGGNLGYSGGINVAAKLAGTAEHLLVLNPDLSVSRGAIKAMLARMRHSGAGAVVPRLLDDDGQIYHSLRREPSLSRSIGDAVVGSRFPDRPAWLSEIETDAESYVYARQVSWATGAAILIRSELAAKLGPWDERFFLYSEETDYFRKIRNAGGTIWFEPLAVMNHERGGSGSSAGLTALMAVNKVRYAQAHHSRLYSLAMRGIVAAASVARATQPGHRMAAGMLLGMRSWENLPKASPGARPLHRAEGAFPSGTVIIPAYNEAGVLARTLRPLANLAASGAIEVIVACNGCSDGSAAVASTFPGVVVLDLQEPGKTSALNAADAIATRWPRIYLDADIEITAGALAEVFAHLAQPGALAARPTFRYDTSGADLRVRSYYRARTRIRGMQQHLWGAGAYAVSAAGHARFPTFPEATADDAYVDSLFMHGEKVILDTPPLLVRTPRSTRELHHTLRRIYRGNHELAPGTAMSSGLANLAASITGPLELMDAGVYASLAFAGKLRRGNSLTVGGGWDRDESSRLA